MQTVKRRCAQTAHISLQIQIFKERRHKTSRTLLPASLPALHPEYFRDRFRCHCRFLRSAIQRLVVFGEALSTDADRWPQVENDGKMTIFSAAQDLLGFLRPVQKKNAWPAPLPRR